MKLNVQELPQYTYEDYARWEGDWELICGVPYDMTPKPIVRHQKASIALVLHLGPQLEGIPDAWIFSDSDWIVSEDTTVAPDIMIGCGEITGDYLDFPPTLIVEILSPSTAAKDRGIKFKLYEEQGVTHYVLVDPAQKTIERFELVDGKYAEQKSLDGIMIQGQLLKIDPASIFAG